MPKFDFLFYLLVISTILIFLLMIIIGLMKHKKQIHYAFLGLTFSITIWDLAFVLQIIFKSTPFYSSFLEELIFFGAAFSAVSFFYIGLIFAKSKIDFYPKHIIVFIIPIISTIILFTNSLHHLFYVKYSLLSKDFIPGSYYMIHTFYSYALIFVGLYYLAYFSIKNSGFFSKQSMLILIGTFLPFCTDSFSTFNLIPHWPTYIENIAFSFTVICFILAIIKFDFLNILPIALQKVVDLISDSYVIVNEDFEIVDYNKTFIDTFGSLVSIKRKDNINELFKKSHSNISEITFMNYVEISIIEKKTITLEKHIDIADFSRYFFVEIIPVFFGNQHVGTILLNKDITEQKKNVEQLMEFNEKLNELVNKDGLTQTFNRYFFDERLQQEIDRVKKQIQFGHIADFSAEDFGLIMFDIDYFKNYNDTNGHLAGDNLLKEIVQVIKSVLYTTDIFCRYGGEEFMIICCKTRAEGVKIVAEKVRATVAEHEFKFQEKQPNGNLTISIGTSNCPSDALTIEDLINKADSRLYLAKSRGRNTVVSED